jgi:hypothetical protein
MDEDLVAVITGSSSVLVKHGETTGRYKQDQLA